MKTKNILLLVCGIVLIPYYTHAATCSRANLTRCLDSACAININSNPAARCQYCGTSGAGTPPAGTGMRSISVGQSAKYNLTDKELKKAPTDNPGARYAWATTQCLAKLPDCTPDDVSDVYDQLIEQSCKAAGIDAQLANLQAEAKKKPTKSSCATSVRACMLKDDHCNSDWNGCKEDANFDKYFSECGISATGCDSFLSAIRSDMISARDTTIANADTAVDELVRGYQNARERRLASIVASCKKNEARDTCVTTVCKHNMRNNCDANHPAEKSMALQLCKFYELACNTVN